MGPKGAAESNELSQGPSISPEGYPIGPQPPTDSSGPTGPIGLEEILTVVSVMGLFTPPLTQEEAVALMASAEQYSNNTDGKRDMETFIKSEDGGRYIQKHGLGENK